MKPGAGGLLAHREDDAVLPSSYELSTEDVAKFAVPSKVRGEISLRYRTGTTKELGMKRMGYHRQSHARGEQITRRRSS